MKKKERIHTLELEVASLKQQVYVLLRMHNIPIDVDLDNLGYLEGYWQHDLRG